MTAGMENTSMLPIIRTHTNDSGSLLNDSQQQQDYGDDYFYGHYGGEDGGGGVGDFRVEHYIWIVGGAVLLLLGSAGNALSLAVLTRPRMRRSNVSVYLMVVAVADLVSLYTGLLRHIIQTATGKDVRQHSAAMCKIHTTVVYFSLDLSAWLLAALSVERCISVKWPHRVKPHCTRMTSVGVITGLGLLLFAVNAHFFFLVGDLTVAVGNNQTRVVRCVPLSEEGYNFVAIVWPWLDLSLYALLPLIVHIVCNSIIVRSVLRSIRKTGRTRGSGAGLSVVGSTLKQTATARDRNKRREIHNRDQNRKSENFKSKIRNQSEIKNQNKNQELKEFQSKIRDHSAIESLNSRVRVFTRNVEVSESSDDLNVTNDDDASHQSVFVTDCSRSNDVGFVIDGISSDLSHRGGSGEDSTDMMNTTFSSEDQNNVPINHEDHQTEDDGDIDSGHDVGIHSASDLSNSARASQENRSTSEMCRICSEECSNIQNSVLAETKECNHLQTSGSECNKTETSGSECSIIQASSVAEGKKATKSDSESNKAEKSESKGNEIKTLESTQECNKSQISRCSKDQASESQSSTRTQKTQELRSRSSLITTGNGESGSRPGPSMTNGNEKSGSRTRPSMMAKNPKSDNKLKLKTKQCQSGRSSSSERLRTPRARGSGGQQPSSEEHRVSSMTLMLVTVSTVFCLTTLPISLYTLINWIMVDTGYIHPYGQVTWAVLNVLMYTNHSINFLLYSLSGTRFRGQMTAMFRCQCFSKGRRSPRTHGHPHHQSRWSSFSSSSSYSMSMLSSSAPAVGSLQSTVHGRRWSSPSTQLGSCS